MQINDVEFNAELEDILEELKDELAMNGITLLQKIKPSGDDIMVQCPYHGEGHEKRPSAGIRKSDGMFHCFACGETHSLPEVISHCFGRDEMGSFGWKWLLQNFGTVQVEERKDVNFDFGRNIHRTDSNCLDKQFVTEEELDKYRYTHPYMYKRRMTDEIIQLFDIGFDRDSDCITFPIRDKSGRCLFVARRSVRTKYFSYPQGVEKPLYGLYELYQLDKFPSEVIVCESMIDAITCWVYGKYAVALNGLGNDLQFKQLRDLPCRKLILATDSDNAGMRARKRIRANVRNKIITEYLLPEGRKDINELSREEFENMQEVF